MQLQKYYPAPTFANLLTNNYSAVLPNNNNTDQTVDRLDQNLGDKTRLFFRYQRQQETILVGNANPTSATNGPVYLSNYNIGFTQTFSPTVVNDMRFGRNFFDTATLNHFTVNGPKNVGESLGIPGFNGDVIGNNPGLPRLTTSPALPDGECPELIGTRTIPPGKAQNNSVGTREVTTSCSAQNSGRWKRAALPRTALVGEF